MAVLSPDHIRLSDGRGRCSVPMWMDDCPAGFCDEPAYGERPPCQEWRHADGSLQRLDGRYSGYVPGLACQRHGGPEKPEEVPACQTETDVALADLRRTFLGEAEHRRMVRRALSRAEILLTALDQLNEKTFHRWNTLPGRVLRKLEPQTEAAMCALRAALAEVPAL